MDGLIVGIDVDGLGSVLCAIVDYKGIRYVGQSIIPGIFNQGDNCAQLSYGVLEVNKPLTVSIYFPLISLASFLIYICLMIR